jgi:hypothetical protein
LNTPKNKYLELFDEDTPPPAENLLVVGISSNQKAYKMVWQVNTLQGLQLARADDLFFKHRKGQDIYIQCFEYTDEEYGYTYRLVANKTTENILVPEHKNTDYFLLVKGGLEQKEWKELLTGLKKLTFALAVYEVNFTSLKNKHILYF